MRYIAAAFLFLMMSLALGWSACAGTGVIEIPVTAVVIQNGDDLYAKAYTQAITRGKPLVVFLTSRTCAPCRRMKRLVDVTDCSQVVLVTLRAGKSKAAKAISKGRTVPQFHFYDHVDGKLLLKRSGGVMSGDELDEFLQTGAN